jgi:hypothetical protein
MIDPLTEYVVTLRQAAKSCPRRRSGKHPHVSCMYRWTTEGCRGVVLESIQVGGTRCTSHEALKRFFRRLTDNAQRKPNPEPLLPPDSAIARTLDAEGLGEPS